jgi:hypothetical protein
LKRLIEYCLCICSFSSKKEGRTLEPVFRIGVDFAKGANAQICRFPFQRSLNFSKKQLVEFEKFSYKGISEFLERVFEKKFKK